MAVSPFIRPIRVQGGTFYTFPSCVEDINFSFTNPTYDISFSKFALLDIPNLATPENNENYIQLRSIPGSYAKVYDESSDPNIAFANMFQDYALNLETLITSSPNYDSTALSTISERVFFKWLKEVGALRFREANSSETATNSSSIGQRFVEEDDTTAYSRVIKYVGDIDLVNTSKLDGSTQAEIYIHIPTETGNSPYVLYRSDTKDTNYSANSVYKYSPANADMQAYISGRTADDVHPAGLDTRAYYDSEGDYTDGSTYQLFKKDSTGTYVQNAWWWPYASNNTYFLEPTRLNDPRNDDFKIRGIGAEAGNDIFFRRSRLDGIGIDFDLLNYQQAVQQSASYSWAAFNQTTESVSFDFNAVLVYYDLVSKSDPTQKATNLYGVLFLDDLQSSTSGAYIPRLTKYKPNKDTNMNGNSYGLRVNLRLDVNVNDTSVQSSINDYNTFSLQLFNEALTELRNASDLLLTHISSVSLLEDRINSLDDTMLTQTATDPLNARITALEDNYEANQAYFANASSLMDLINRNYQTTLDIYNNKTSVQVQYNVDVLTPGDGINLNKKGGKLEISSNQNGYAINKSNPFIDLQRYTQTSTTYNYSYQILSGTNYIILKTVENSVFEPNMDMVLSLDDSTVQFKSGQVIKVCFSTPVNLLKTSTLLDRRFVVVTDSTNRSGGSSPYSVVIGSFNSQQFAVSGNKPYFEIVCLDPATYTFNIEKIR